MITRRHAWCAVVLFLFAIPWNGLIHLVVLAEADASVAHLRRADFDDKLWLSLLLVAGIVGLFLAGYTRFARTRSIREGAVHGLCFGCLAGLLVDLNQYLVYPLPAGVVVRWFLAGLVEFTTYGIVASRICPAHAEQGVRL